MLPPPSILVGRERELKRLASALDLVAVAVIDGVAGVGKSALARAAAARWAGPVAVATLRTSPSIAALREDVHRQIGAAGGDVAGDEAHLAQLWSLLDRHGALLVIDDLESWDADRRGALVRSALGGLHRGRVLAVSREQVPRSPGDPDRLQLRLDGLDRPAAAQLWDTLIALYGPGCDFELGWQCSRGNPLVLRQAHARRAEAERPLDELFASLGAGERELATLLAVAPWPVPPVAIAAAGCDPAALEALVMRLVIDVDADGNHAVHPLIRDRLLHTSDVTAARRRLADVLRTARAVEPHGAPLLIDATCHEVRVGGVLLHSLGTRLSLRRLLYAFAGAPDGVLGRDAIAAVLWKAAYDPLRHESSIKSSIRRLRALLVGTGAMLEAVTDAYRLQLPPEATFQRTGCSASQRSTRTASLRVLGVA